MSVRLRANMMTGLACVALAGCGYDRKMAGVMASYDAGQYKQAASEIQRLSRVR